MIHNTIVEIFLTMNGFDPDPNAVAACPIAGEPDRIGGYHRQYLSTPRRLTGAQYALG
jgi:hypothetical protein